MKKFILLFLPLIGFASLPPEIPYTNKGLIFFPCNFDNQDQKLFNAFADTVLGNILSFTLIVLMYIKTLTRVHLD